MHTKQLFVFGASVLAAALGGGAVAQQANGQYIQVAEIEIDPAQLEAYRAAVQEQIEAAIRAEPGVLVLYAVSDTILLASRSSKFIATWMPIDRISHLNISRNTRPRRRRWSGRSSSCKPRPSC